MQNYDLSRLSVLIVEDNRHMQGILRNILRGFYVTQVECCDDGPSAFHLMKDKFYDLVLLDWDIPTIDGRDFTRLVRTGKDSRYPYIPIIMITAANEKRLVMEARDAGITEFLAKPVSASSVYARIVSVIERPRPFVKTRTYVGPCRRRHINVDYKGPERRAGPLSQADIDAVITKAGA